MTWPEALLVGLVLGFGMICFVLIGLRENKLQKELREFRDSVKKSLSGINKELIFSNFLKVDEIEVENNEN